MTTLAAAIFAAITIRGLIARSLARHDRRVCRFAQITGSDDD